jgi:hypothetical protein
MPSVDFKSLMATQVEALQRLLIPARLKAILIELQTLMPMEFYAT